MSGDLTNRPTDDLPGALQTIYPIVLQKMIYQVAPPPPLEAPFSPMVRHSAYAQTYRRFYNPHYTCGGCKIAQICYCQVATPSLSAQPIILET